MHLNNSYDSVMNFLFLLFFSYYFISLSNTEDGNRNRHVDACENVDINGDCLQVVDDDDEDEEGEGDGGDGCGDAY